MKTDARFRLSRCGVINVWQYDRQVFEFADGRLLLRGANGAGKSKTMEMLLPFAIDGDKARLTASGRHHTSLLWLLLDGYEGQARTGYVWVEFTRTTDKGATETLTCGVGMRATQAARAASAWFFTSPRRVGEDLLLEDVSGPLSRQQLEAEVTSDGTGQFFDQPVRYREHVGQRLFGLPRDQYDDLLRLIYWLRQPQVGEDIDPKRLAEQLVNALPQVDDSAVRAAGDTFDELEAFGDRIERRGRAASALREFVDLYAAYARSVVAARGAAILEADGHVRRLTANLRRAEHELTDVTTRKAAAASGRSEAEQRQDGARDAIKALESGPEARSRQRLLEMGRTVDALAGSARSEERRRDEAGARAGRSSDVADRGATALAEAIETLMAMVSDSSRGLSSVGAAHEAPAHGALGALATPGEVLVWRDSADAQRIDVGLAQVRAWAGAARAVVSGRQAVVSVVRAAFDDAEAARREADDAEREEVTAQVRADETRERADEARQGSRAAEEALLESLTGWRSASGAVAFELPALDANGLARLDALARGAAAPEVDRLGTAAGAARAALAAANARHEDLGAALEQVRAQVDPEPSPPLWPRDSREGREGAPFWRLVDFATDLGADERAGLEAALGAAGVLDAWVRPDGKVEGERLDVHLSGEVAAAPTATPVGVATLADLLRVDDAAPGAVPPAVVGALLETVGLLSTEVPDTPDAPVCVGVDGSWRTGPLHGRTTKPVAQFIGSTARAAERRRRIAQLEGQRDTVAQEIGAVTAELEEAQHRLALLHEWLDSRPTHEPVLRAWAAQEEREATAERFEREQRDLAARARKLRAAAATRHTVLVDQGQAHDLPITAGALDARAGRLRDLDEHLKDHDRTVAGLAQALARWTSDAVAAAEDSRVFGDSHREATEAHDTWTRRRKEHEELVRLEGASVEQLEASLAEQRTTLADARRLWGELDTEHQGLVGEEGSLAERLTSVRTQLAQAGPVLVAAQRSLAELDARPGLVAAACPPDEGHRAQTGEADGGDGRADGGDDDAADGGDDDAADGVRVLRLGELTVPDVRRLVTEIPDAPADERALNTVLQGVSALQSGDAAVHEPRVLDEGGVLVAVGRDESGDLPMVELAQRLTRSVDRDRELLTERERKLFEEHVLGQLGDALRAVRLKADELVQAMNDQLLDVTTSQGIRVRLRWRLRNDVPAEARRAVALLGQPLGALLPGERAELRESLHRLIEVSRAEAPEEPYAVHLARALDYRRWNAFTVQYHRPEAREWRDLQRRTALSQGEQKVLCYLPLFAAAAAHFTSVAGAAPHAPRFVLLDDAFPKIDVRTHPLLFGLLVDLDLDFVITSERLWGTHPTVPRLAIYEALRSPGEPGIAQYEHRWDGQRLTAVGNRS